MAVDAPSSSPVAAKPAAREDRRLLLRYHSDGDLRARDELVVRFLPAPSGSRRNGQWGRFLNRGAANLDVRSNS